MEVNLFTIITICYNDLEGLNRTYESVIKQTCRNFEWIVVDGASSDGTIRFLEDISEEYASWVSEPDNGLYDAMNKGIDRANGKYLHFLNSGDEFAKCDTLEHVQKAADEYEYEYDLIYGDALEVKSERLGNYKSAYSFHRKWYGMFTHHQAMFYRRECVGTQRYDLSYKIAADYAFTCSMLESTSNVRYIEIPICLFEGGGLTSTTSIHIQGLKEQWRVGKEILNRSFFQRFGTLFLLLGKHSLMRLSPALYNKIRYRQAS